MAPTHWVSLIVFAIGVAIAAVGVGLYEAWWTAAFAFGGALVGWFGPRLTSPTRPVAIGVAASGAALLGGMSVFLLLGSFIRGGTPWLLAAIGSIAAAIALALMARRLLATPARDIHRR